MQQIIIFKYQSNAVRFFKIKELDKLLYYYNFIVKNHNNMAVF